MAEGTKSTSLAKKNPCLIKYFKYMVNSRQLTITFTPSKVIEILQNDLQIDLSKFNDNLREVSVAMFTFYIQNWPGWQPKNFQNCINNPEDSYAKFKYYLKEKIVGLSEKQKNLENTKFPVGLPEKTEFTPNGPVLKPPTDVDNTLPNDTLSLKTKYPYTLEISMKPKQLELLKFSEINNHLVVSVVEKPLVKRIISNFEVLNHPCVSLLFKIPQLIKFSRKNTTRKEMFLCKNSDNWQFPIQDKIIDIRKHKARDNVYTSAFLKVLFENIVGLFDKHKVENVKKDEVEAILGSFLNDVIEADLYDSTVQECTEITLSIGGSAYISDYGGTTLLRTIYQPALAYSLIYCGIDQSKVNDNGITYFQQLEKENGEHLSTVLSQLSQSIDLTCQMCNLPFNQMDKMKQHLFEHHNSTQVVSCTRCKLECHLHEIMHNRWYHDCRKRRKNNNVPQTAVQT